MSAVIIGDGLVHYEAIGRGPPLLFIHGWLGSWRYWVPTMEELSIEYRTYALDLWGFGDSDRLDGHYDVESYVTLVRDFITTLGIKPPIPLVGHALGAVTAVLLAARHPDMVSRVMAVSLPLLGETLNPRLSNQGGSIPIDRVLGRRLPPEYESVRVEAIKAEESAVIGSANSVRGLNLSPKLARIQVPVLLVHGERDNVVPPPQAERLNGLLGTGSQIHFITLPSTRHFPMLEEKAKFNRLLRDFLVTDDLDTLQLKEEWRRLMR